ncbi:MAG: peptidylprolyl isomerase [Victivallales bacterium]|nr:peptidylprolyl isomerase [Victivallales bacterium]
MKHLFSVIIAALFAFSAFAQQQPQQTADDKNGQVAPKNTNPIIRIATSKGDMKFELYEDLVPNTVANMIELAEKGFFKGMSFHRVIKDFMAQGGCPYSKRDAHGQPGTGGPGYRFADEITPKLRHTERGILSMANSGENTNGSQFFICFKATPWLDGCHTVFGKIIEGMEVLDKIEALSSTSGKTSERIQFNIEVISKRDHEYKVKKIQ